MKNIIHIGYPKTATTTLQHKVFFELHKQSKINFLGKTLIGFNPSVDYLTYLLENGKEVDIKLKKNNINLISEELFSSTYLHYLDNNNEIISLDLKKISYKLKKTFQNAQIVVSLRNHSDLIYSLYVQSFISHFKKLNINSPQEFVDIVLNKLDEYKPLWKMYYFYETISIYANEFGKDNIKILFYEDLLNNEDCYYQEWADFLEVDMNIIKNLFENKENTKKIGKKGYKVELTYGYILSSILHKTNLISLYRLIQGTQIASVGKKIYSILNKKIKEEYEFDKLDEIMREKIKNHFKEDTYKLIKEFNLDEKKLKKYNYI